MGFMSVPLGIGAGSLGVPFLKTLGYSINIAIGTSATIGIVNAICGATSMAISGILFFDVSVPYSFGFINIAGVFGICSDYNDICSFRSKNNSLN